MQAFKLNQPVPELQPIGSNSLLGRQQKAIPRVAVAMIYGKPDDVFTCGSVFIDPRRFLNYDLSLYRARNRAGREVELTVVGQEPIRFSPR